MKMYACSYEENPYTVSRRKLEQQRGERGRFVSQETVEAIHEVTETPTKKTRTRKPKSIPCNEFID